VNDRSSQPDLKHGCFICVEGNLDPKWSGYFENLRIFPGGDGWTLLYGSPSDQAALLGALEKIHGLGLTIHCLFQDWCRISSEEHSSGGDPSRGPSCPAYLIITDPQRDSPSDNS